MNFKQYPLSHLLVKPHPELPAGNSNFDIMCRRVRSGQENALLTHLGEPLVFLMAKLPDALIHENGYPSGPFSKKHLTATFLKQRKLPALCFQKTLPRFWLIPFSYKDLVGLPELQPLTEAKI